MGLDGVFNVPDFQYIHKVERQGQNSDGQQKRDQHKKKKKDDEKNGALFESLADSLSHYSDEPFTFNG